MSESSRDQAIERMMNEMGVDEKTASSELKRRIKAVKSVIALAAYRDWAVEKGYLLGGPELDIVKYKRIHQIIESKCYHSNDTLVLSVWDLVDLCNTRTFNEFRRESDVVLFLDEILLLSRSEYKAVRASRTVLSQRRKKQHG